MEEALREHDLFWDGDREMRVVVDERELKHSGMSSLMSNVTKASHKR